ncbi:hypothetical protein D3C76_134700 [compost metagenome]
MSSEDKALDITIENVGILRERLERAEIALQTIAELPIAEQDNILDRMVPSDLRLLVGERDKLEAENQALKAKNAECQHMLADIVVRHFAENITRSTAQKSMDVYLSEGIRLLEEELEALRSRVVVVPERLTNSDSISKMLRDLGRDGYVAHHHAREIWNACLDELARLNGKTVSMADIRDCLDAELREWTGDHRKAVEVALTDAHERIHALLESTQDGAAHKG